MSRWFSILPWFLIASATGSPTLSYNRDIRPILSDKCFHCHGPDPKTREAGLRLDVREDAVKKSDEAIAIVPGNSKTSEAILRIFSTDADEMMPQPKAHLDLTQGEKELLKRWVDEGAEYQPHWAFVPLPSSIPVPETKNSDWPKNEIDRFVLNRLATEKLSPTPAASRERWLRRVTFDLTGLPPTQPELDAFLADVSTTSFEKVADRLLASPRFGERMATPWLDVARYADSFGYQADADMHTWPYRDWVIRMFNENLPWDQFIIQQLAGDLLPNSTRDQKLATAFNRLHRKTNEGGSVPEEFRQDGISDRIHTVGTAFLGLTFECARCHDHKYDPISAKDYYSLGAFFNSIDEHGLVQGGGSSNLILPQPALQLPTPDQESTLEKQRAQILNIEQTLAAIPSTHEADFQTWLTTSREPIMPDLAGNFPLDEIVEGNLPNAADPAKPGKAGGNRIDAGKTGNAIQCNGDEPVALPDFGIKHCHDPLTISFWLKPVENYPRAVVFANSSSYDANYSGYELLLENGFLRWTLMREFPGNAISIQSNNKPVKTGEWTHVTVTYDGSSKSAGLQIFLNGISQETKTIRDGLKRDYRIGGALNFAARMRDFGLRGGSLDEIRIYNRALTSLEAAQNFDRETLSQMLVKTGCTPEEIAQLREYYFSAVHPKSRENATALLAARAAERATVDGVQEISVMEELPEPAPAFVLLRGGYDQLGEPVSRETPAALPPMPEEFSRDRLGFAKWLTMPDHPLTARVIVNRLWQEFFGKGIVTTPDNFGLQGALPTHPEMLDWLARDFVNHGWDYKRACRQIVLSATYRQDSRTGPELREKDPDNALLARGPARRLTAEMIRDSALSVAGLLRPDIGGKPVQPYQPDGSMWKSLNNFLPEYKTDTGTGVYRRSLYTFWRRTTTPPNMMVFDSGTRDTCSAKRQTTNTPLQPLVMLNDPQFVEAARALGERMLRDGGESDESRVTWAFREVVGRNPNEKEIPVLIELYQSQREIFSKEPVQANQLLGVGQLKADLAFQPVEAAAAAMVASALINLDASITLR